MATRSIKGELVDLERYRFIIEPRYYFYGWAGSPHLYARRAVVRALARARKFLPRGYNFKIWDAWRSYTVDARVLKGFRERLRALHPQASSTEIRNLQQKFGGQALKRVARVDTHRNGGSVDLTIVDRTGRELYMGTDHDDLTAKAALDYFDTRRGSSILQERARRNRRLLKRVMNKGGFTPYAPEWWHWS